MRTIYRCIRTCRPKPFLRQGRERICGPSKSFPYIFCAQGRNKVYTELCANVRIYCVHLLHVRLVVMVIIHLASSQSLKLSTTTTVALGKSSGFAENVSQQVATAKWLARSIYSSVCCGAIMSFASLMVKCLPVCTFHVTYANANLLCAISSEKQIHAHVYNIAFGGGNGSERQGKYVGWCAESAYSRFVTIVSCAYGAST